MGRERACASGVEPYLGGHGRLALEVSVEGGLVDTAGGEALHLQIGAHDLD